MDLRPVRYPSDLFTVYKDKQELVTYISDLEANKPGREVFGRVYDDACDEGFTMVSTKTGQEAIFAFDGREVDGEGDVLLWRLVPTRDTVRRLPNLKGWSAVLIND